MITTPHLGETDQKTPPRAEKPHEPFTPILEDIEESKAVPDPKPVEESKEKLPEPKAEVVPPLKKPREVKI